MNKYLLLRDNKQSGPYTVDELATHGLKPYDLVWLEGRSAAWRYPSEIEELKPFAPIVEEQPFDRFYRKAEPKTIEAPAKDNTRVQQNQLIQNEVKKFTDQITPTTQQANLNKGTKKVHVSLPVNVASISNEKTTSLEQPRSSTVATEPQSNAGIVAPLRNAVNEVPVSNLNQKNFTPSFSNIDSPSSLNLEEAYKKIKQVDTTKIASPVPEKPVSKFLFRSVAAVCLLLGGALIGLIINYNSQQKKFQQLNQLVQEIKQQDNPGVSKNVKNDQLSAALPTPAETNIIPGEKAEEQVYKEELQLPPAKKDKKPVKPVKPAADSASSLQQTQEAVQAVSENTEPVHKIDKVASELAKKNLWQLVSVDHNKYKTGVFGGVSNLSIKLSNKSLVQLQQVEVEVLFLSPEKKPVNKQKIVFENVSPGEQLQIDVPKSSRGVKVEYSIKKIVTKEFELAHAGM